MKQTLKQTVTEILGREVSTKEAKEYSETNYLELVRFIHHEKKIEDLKRELKTRRGIKQNNILGLRLSNFKN